MTPDRHGAFGDVVLGYDTLDEYMKNPRYLGALIGRFANRIGRGKFSLNGVEYQLAQNNGENHLHGGKKGFDKRVWKATERPSGLHQIGRASCRERGEMPARAGQCKW